MSKFPVCRICGAMLADESLREKHDEWHSRVRLLDGSVSRAVPRDDTEVEELATLIQETFPTGAGGYSLIWEDCFPAARAILAAGYTK